MNLLLEEFEKKEGKKNALSASQRLKVCREFLLQRLQNVENLTGMDDFEALDRDRLPKSHHSLQSFINQSASREAQSAETNDVMVDWNAPIKMKLVLLPDSVT